MRPEKDSFLSPSQHRVSLLLVTRPKYPPYHETGVAKRLSHCVSCDIADYRCYTPTSFPKNGLSQSKDRPDKVGIAEKPASEAYPPKGRRKK